MEKIETIKQEWNIHCLFVNYLSKYISRHIYNNNKNNLTGWSKGCFETILTEYVFKDLLLEHSHSCSLHWCPWKPWKIHCCLICKPWNVYKSLFLTFQFWYCLLHYELRIWILETSFIQNQNSTRIASLDL